MTSFELPPSQPVFSTEQLEQLHAGPGTVRTPVDILSSSDIKNNLGNFYLHFLRSGMIPDIYRQQPHFQRFTIIYPDLTDELERTLDEGTRGLTQLGEQLHSLPALLNAYELMRGLVDANDPGVTQSGVIDNKFLIR